MAWQRIGVRASLNSTHSAHREAAVVFEEVGAINLVLGTVTMEKVS